jgi:single-stranded-DNA-specific exonuclease
MTIADEQLESFRRKFEEVVESRIQPEHLSPILTIDGVADLKNINRPLIKMVEKMAPFGPGNLQPVFATESAEAVNIQILKDQHLKFKVVQGDTTLDAIAFGMADKIGLLEDGPVAIAYHADINRFRGNESVQLIIKDIRPELGK